MQSIQGFLLSGPNGPRMTESQRDGVFAAVKQALDVAERSSSDATVRGAILLARTVVAAALRAYPIDRSCVTCDYYTREVGAYCCSWRQPIPEQHVETGCSRHQTDGAPF